MVTTVQLSEGTKTSLETYKEMIGAETYEEAIAHLLRVSGGESAFGSMEGWGPWTPDDRMRSRSDEE